MAKLETLMRKADPGPLRVGKYEPDEDLQSIVRIWNGDGMVAADVSEEQLGRDRAMATARLLAHWYNNGPKLLKALRRLLEDDGQGQTTADGERFCKASRQAQKAAGKAEEVAV